MSLPISPTEPESKTLYIYLLTQYVKWVLLLQYVYLLYRYIPDTYYLTEQNLRKYMFSNLVFCAINMSEKTPSI